MCAHMHIHTLMYTYIYAFTHAYNWIYEVIWLNGTKLLWLELSFSSITLWRFTGQNKLCPGSSGGKASAHFGAYSNIYILFHMPNRDKADLKPMFENMQFSTIGNLISRNQKQLQKYLLKLLSWKQWKNTIKMLKISNQLDCCCISWIQQDPRQQ